MCPENIDIYISSDQNLRASGLGGLLLKKGKQAVGGGAGNDFKYARLTQLAKSRKQIAFALLDKETPAFRKDLEIKIREFSKFWMIKIPFLLALY